jgi:hypothetical protein
MSTQTNATISPDRAASDADLIADTVPSSRPANKKQRQEEADDTPGPVAKVARLASSEEETQEQAADETTDAPLTTEKIMILLKDLWSDDKSMIQRALIEIADIGDSDAPPHENELKMRGLGVHIAVFQVLQKHIGCLEIQEEGMCALGDLSLLLPTKKLLGEIGCVEVILASMEKYPEFEYIQAIGCFTISKISNMKANAERVEKSGGIAVVIAAMKTHQNSETVQDCGCYVLSIMSEWEEYRTRIVEAGGTIVIASMMHKYRDHPQLRKRSFDAMKILATE